MYREHIESLADDLRVRVQYTCTDFKQVCCKPHLRLVSTFKDVEDEGNYLSTLHELGHIACEHYFPTIGPAAILEEEAEAWVWAFEHALDPPSYEAQRQCWDWGLLTYWTGLRRVYNGNVGPRFGKTPAFQRALGYFPDIRPREVLVI